MQTSEKKKKAGKIVRKIVVFLVIAGLLNALLTFLITPYSSPSQEMWKHYYNLENQDVDMVYLGTSMSYTSINPRITNEMTGYHAYNMGTNAQSYANSLTALERAIRDHGIKRAVLVLDYAYLETGSENHGRPDTVFIHAMNQGRPLRERIRNDASFLFNPNYFGKSQSMNFWFPWVNSGVSGGLNGWLNNVGAKLGLVKLKAGDGNNIRNRFGFKPWYRQVNYDSINEASQKWSEKNMSKESVENLNDICQLCRTKQVDLTVIVTPGPTSMVLSYGKSYFSRMETMKKFFHDRGIGFYDFNLAKPSLYAGSPTYYKDNDHLNVQGAAVFSRTMGRFLNALKRGEDLSDEFYTPAEYVASIHYIDSVFLSARPENGTGIYAKAKAYTGSQVYPEYSYVVKRLTAGNPEGEDVARRRYTSDPEFFYKPEKQGTYQIRVYVRQKGAGSWERKGTAVVEYWKR